PTLSPAARPSPATSRGLSGTDLALDRVKTAPRLTLGRRSFGGPEAYLPPGGDGLTSSETIPRSEGTITTRFDGPIARIVINRPERLNCLVDSMREELTGALDSMGSRPGVQLVI